MKKRKKRLMAALAACAGAGLLALAGLDNRLAVRRYTVTSGQVSAPVRLALLTDLHSCAYGPLQRELLDAVALESPDLVLLGGDIVDDRERQSRENAYLAVKELARLRPTYYVSGNHEFRTGECRALKEELARRGAVVLAGDCLTVEAGGQSIQLCGVDDPDVGEGLWLAQLKDAAAAADPGLFTVLLSHRPERVEAYLAHPFDLILSGHAHGGQWRIPGLLNGLLAPNQGFFPPYAGGRYDFAGAAMVVSRGLARESTRVPRLYNPPELVIIDVIPAP